jgi:AcrR family transcriptional regulator
LLASALPGNWPGVARYVTKPVIACAGKGEGKTAGYPDNPAMARPQSATFELKREEILGSAATCFADKSYPAASMNDIAAASGTSKARLYHYYGAKEAILFDLLERYTQRLLGLIGQVEATSQRRSLNDRAALHELVRCFLVEYETSATRHVALLNDTKFLGTQQRELILNRQRDVVAATTRFVRRAYPERVTASNQTAVAMMLFGMINWTFTWLRPGGPMSYAMFANEVIALLDRGLAQPEGSQA